MQDICDSEHLPNGWTADCVFAQVDAASKIQNFWRQKTEEKEKAKEAKEAKAKGKKPSKEQEKASPHTSPKAPWAARPSQGRWPTVLSDSFTTLQFALFSNTHHNAVYTLQKIC